MNNLVFPYSVTFPYTFRILILCLVYERNLFCIKIIPKIEALDIFIVVGIPIGTHNLLL